MCNILFAVLNWIQCFEWEREELLFVFFYQPQQQKKTKTGLSLCVELLDLQLHMSVTAIQILPSACFPTHYTCFIFFCLHFTYTAAAG